MFRWLIVLLAFSSPLLAQQPAGQYEIQTDVQIPLRDGIKLGATLYRPSGAIERRPVVFTLTPYMADTYHERAEWFARNDTVFLLIDSRGRGNSGGRFSPFLQEANDAFDVVQWLAKQPFSTGEVTMWGGSYAGYNQWMAASKQPKALYTIVPVASPYPPLDFPMSKNISYPYVMRWLTLTSGKLAQNNLFGDNAFWTARAMPLYRGERPFAELDQVVGNPSPIFREWVKHPAMGKYWDQFVPTDKEMAAIDLPILSITGQYDGDQAGALEFYRRHMQFASATARAKHFLVIGPWDHAGTRTPRAEVGGLTFGEASLVDLNALHLAWYEYARGKAKRPAFLIDQVNYYVTGSERWRSAPTLEAVSATTSTLYLSSPKGNPGSVWSSGALTLEEPTAADIDDYSYNPLDFRRNEVEAQDKSGELSTQRTVLAIQGDGLIYQSDPIPEARELAGRPSAKLFISTNVPDTDIAIALYEISADGDSVLLSQDAMRLRYRDSLQTAKPYQPDTVVELNFNGFSFFARELKAGSRLRMVVTSPNSPGLQKNWNSGGEVAKETAKDAKTAMVELHLGEDAPSALRVGFGLD